MSNNTSFNKQEVLERILQELNDSVLYVIVRSEQEFFDNLNLDSFDIDIFVESTRSYLELNKILECYGFIKNREFDTYHNPFFGFWFDVHFKKMQRYPYVNVDNLVQRREYKRFYFASPIDQIKINLMQPLDLAGFRGLRAYSEKKIDYIKRKEEFLSQALFEISEESGESISVIVGKKYHSGIFYFSVLEQLYLKYHLIKNRPFVIYKFFERILTKMRGLFLKRAKIFVVCGVDGAGKTTLIGSLEEVLSKSEERFSVKYFGLLGGYSRFTEGLLKLYGRLKNKKPSSKVDVNLDENAVASNRSSNLKEVLKDIMVAVESFNRLVALLFLLHVRRGHVIADRYVYDAYVSGKGGGRIVRWLARFYPAPEVVFFLKGQPEKIFERKREYSPEVITIQQEELAHVLLNAGVPVKELNAHEKPGEIVEIASKYIYQSLR